jgi:hypothetical protein
VGDAFGASVKGAPFKGDTNVREESLAILVSSLVDRALREMLRLTIVSVRSTQPSSFAECSDIAVRVPFRVEGEAGAFVLFGTEEFFEVAAHQRRREVSAALRRGNVHDAAIALGRALATRLHLELALRGIELTIEEPDASGIPLQVARNLRPMTLGGAMTLLYACQGHLFACLVDVGSDSRVQAPLSTDSPWPDEEAPTSVRRPVIRERDPLEGRPLH